MKITFTKEKIDLEKTENNSDVFSLEIDLPKDTTWGTIVPLLKTYDFFDEGDYVWVLNNYLESEFIAYYSFCDKVFFFDSTMKIDWIERKKNVCAMAGGKPLNFLRQSRTQRARSLFEGYGCSDYMMWHEGVDGQFDLCDISKAEKDRWEKDFRMRGQSNA